MSPRRPLGSWPPCRGSVGDTCTPSLTFLIAPVCFSPAVSGLFPPSPPRSSGRQRVGLGGGHRPPVQQRQRHPAAALLPAAAQLHRDGARRHRDPVLHRRAALRHAGEGDQHQQPVTGPGQAPRPPRPGFSERPERIPGTGGALQSCTIPGPHARSRLRPVPQRARASLFSGPCSQASLPERAL